MICLFWCFVVLIDLICHLSRIGYDEADDQSFERRSCLSLFRSPYFTRSVLVCVPWRCLELNVREGKKDDISHRHWEVFVFSSAGENTISEPLFCPRLPQWSLYLSLTQNTNDSYHFTSNNMLKDRKKILPLVYPSQHFVAVGAPLGFRFSFFLFLKCAVKEELCCVLVKIWFLTVAWGHVLSLWFTSELFQPESVFSHLQRFVGNGNSESVVQNKLSHPVRTRFLRFVPLDWNPSGWMGLRVEVYGCSYSE